MNRLLALIPVLSAVWLGTCGVYEGVRDSDGTKLTLVFMWLATYVLYLVWKRRAIETQVEVIKLLLKSAPAPPAPGVDLVDYEDSTDDCAKGAAEHTKDAKE